MTYYHTVYRVVVLSEIPPNDTDDLRQIAYDIVEGQASGRVEVTATETVDARRMAELLEAQGSDPAFLLGPDFEDGYNEGTETTMGATLDPAQEHSPEWLLGWTRAQADLRENFGPNA